MRETCTSGAGRHGPLERRLTAQQHKLAMTDAMIWQTAVQNNALVYTQDADFADLPQVVYQARPRTP